MVRRMILRGSQTAWRRRLVASPRTGVVLVPTSSVGRRISGSRSGQESDLHQTPAELNDRPTQSLTPTDSFRAPLGTLGVSFYAAAEDRGMERFDIARRLR